MKYKKNIFCIYKQLRMKNFRYTGMEYVNIIRNNILTDERTDKWAVIQLDIISYLNGRSLAWTDT